MVQAYEQMVRECAYFLWIDSGRMDGMAHEHWVVAEKAIAGETRRDALPRAAVVSDKKRTAKAKSSTPKSSTPKSIKPTESVTKSVALTKSAAKTASKSKSAMKSGKPVLKTAALTHGATTH